MHKIKGRVAVYFSFVRGKIESAALHMDKVPVALVMISHGV